MKVKKIATMITSVLCAFAVIGCGNTNTTPASSKPASSRQETAKEVANGMKYSEHLDYILKNTEGNACFSPESLYSALDLYRTILTSDSQKEIKLRIGGRDCLNYQSNDTFKTVNRLWINDALDFHEEKSKELTAGGWAYRMDMSDSVKATAEKDKYVLEQTNGFIDHTNSVFDKNTVVDAMNVIYFKDLWLGGDKRTSRGPQDFTNEDGSPAKVDMFYDFGTGYCKSNNAISCFMEYKNGFKFHVILPNEGVALNEIDINSFITGNTDRSDGEYYLIVPEFETYNEYDLGSPGGEIDPKIYKEKDIQSNILQVAKIKFDHTGTEAAAVTEVVVEATASVSSGKPAEIICNRPFIYWIEDTLNNDVAFIGVVRKF